MHGATLFIAVTRQQKSDFTSDPLSLSISPKFPNSDQRFESIPRPRSARPERRQPKSSGGGAVINGF
jgi:hypothetical protein